MRKGITPVIAIVLLLLITISMVGFASVWFSDMFGQVGQETENRTMDQMKEQGQTIKIDSASSSGIYIRNTGNYEINMSDISVYNNTGRSQCASGIIQPDSVEECDQASCSSGTVRVTGPSNEDTDNCE